MTARATLSPDPADHPAFRREVRDPPSQVAVGDPEARPPLDEPEARPRPARAPGPHTYDARAL
ncbi:hypothetical protein [Streptomyces sp. SCL15-6]|uniref:hypothetical protein n=1 Tax=Streptomyces sp. SCL15-6 TaxID=2967222 RepID=UPI002966F3A7|nr:hypothetical protein [Streptomyces sp. SCL15-6]